MGSRVGLTSYWFCAACATIWGGGVGPVAPLSLIAHGGFLAFQGGESVVGHPNCLAKVEWAAYTPIQVVGSLALFPNSEAQLERMRPGACLAIRVRGEDLDLLKPGCAGCLPEDVARIGPVGDGILYAWNLNGPGDLMASPNPIVYYRLPREMSGPSADVIITCVLRDSGQKAVDASIRGSVQLKLTWLEGEDRIRVQPTIQQPVPDDATTEDVIPRKGHCRGTWIWQTGGEIQGSVEVPPLVGPGQVVLLSAMYEDGDRLELTCAASDCGPHQISPTLPDDVSISWSDSGGGGEFIFGNLGRSVLYRAPPEGDQVRISVVVNDSGTMAGDLPVQVTRQVNILNLKEVNHNKGAMSTFRYVTVGKAYTITPVWEPEALEIERVRWELDLGGEAGVIVREMGKASGLSPEEAALKLTTTNANKGLRISWKKNGHMHGLRKLKCTIFAPSSDLCGICMDDSLERSDFLQGPDFREFKLFFLFRLDGAQRDDGGWRGDRVQAEERYGEGAKVDGKTADHWFTHWAGDTYGPCNQWVDGEGFQLARTDPYFFFAKRLTLAGTQNEIFGVYDHDDARDIDYIRVSRKIAKPTAMPGFRRIPFEFAGSDETLQRVNIDIPAYDLDRVESFCKILNHEIAHWVADVKNWRAPDGIWYQDYGPRRNEPRFLFALKAKSSSSFKVGRRNVSREGIDTKAKYEVSVEVTDSSNVRHRLMVTRGWFKNSKTLYTERIGYEPLPSSAFPPGTDRIIRNGLILVFPNSVTVEVYERPNDPDNDWIPNRIEDEIGTDWFDYITHNNFYHPKRNDREFWAEWLTRDLTQGLVDPAKDWANPGSQTQ